MLGAVSATKLRINFLTESNYRMRVACVNLVRAYELSTIVVLDYAASTYHLYVREPGYRTHIHRLDFLKNYINNSFANQGTSERPESSVLEGSTRRTWLYLFEFCSGIIWKVILKRSKWVHNTKLDQADLNSLCQELFVRGLGFAVHMYPVWFVHEIFFRVRLLGVQSIFNESRRL